VPGLLDSATMGNKFLILIVLAGSTLWACGESTPPETGIKAELEAQPSRLVRLTQAQYKNTIQDLLGEGVTLPVRLEPDSRSAGLIAAGSAATSVSGRGVEQYETAAYDLARQALGDGQRRARIVPCEPSGLVDDVCAGAFVDSFGSKAWRRPVTAEEREPLVGLARDAANVTQDFYRGLEFSMAAILQSPNFLFRPELGSGSGKQRELTSFQLASRLSFFLWNTGPDEELYELAKSDDLVKDDVLRAQVDRMLADPRARRGVRQFFIDHYELDRLDNLTKAPEIFPHISEEVGASAREETLRVLEDIIFDGSGDFRDAITSRKTFLNRKLAAIYNVQAPAREGFAEFEFTEESLRRGILGHVSFLAVWAHPVATSATLRGMFVQQKLLCRVVPPPPAGVDTSIPEPSGTSPTLRDRIQEHLEDPNCASCHNITDKIGLAYENFDGIGRYRRTDDGATLDLSGDLDGVPFDNSADLSDLLRNHSRLGECLTRKMVHYATSSGEYTGASEDLNRLAASLNKNGYDVLGLVRAVALSDAFRRVSVEE